MPISTCKSQKSVKLTRKPYKLTPLTHSTAVTMHPPSTVLNKGSEHNLCTLAIEGRERNVLFNDALNTFYLPLYGVRHMVKDHSDSDKGNPLPPHRLLLSINSKGSFICTIPLQDNTYHGLCYTSRGALAGTRNSSMGPSHEGSIRRPIAP